MLFYFLSGRWSNLAEFDFESIYAVLDGREFNVLHEDVLSITNSLIDPRALGRFPPSQRRRISEAIDSGRFAEAEAMFSTYANHIGINLPSRQTELFMERGERVENLIALQ